MHMFLKVPTVEIGGSTGDVYVCLDAACSIAYLHSGDWAPGTTEIIFRGGSASIRVVAEPGELALAIEHARRSNSSGNLHTSSPTPGSLFMSSDRGHSGAQDSGDSDRAIPTAIKACPRPTVCCWHGGDCRGDDRNGCGIGHSGLDRCRYAPTEDRPRAHGPGDV